MPTVRLPLDPGSQARALLHHLLQHADVAGKDALGRTILTLAVDAWLLEQLMTFDAAAEDLEDGGDAEPDEVAEPEAPLRFDRYPLD